MRRRNLPEVRRCNGGAKPDGWRKSSYSGSSGGCVEACSGEAVIAVRDTKLAASSPVLVFASEAWEAFTASLKAPA